MEQLDGQKEGQNTQKEKVSQSLERLFWWKVCPKGPVFSNEIFLCAWGSVWMAVFWFWNMTKAADVAAYLREKQGPLCFQQSGNKRALPTRLQS